MTKQITLSTRLPSKMYFGFSYRDEEKVTHMKINSICLNLEGLFYVLKTNINDIMFSTLNNKKDPDRNKRLINESVKTINELSRHTSYLQKNEIETAKDAVSDYNKCFPRWLFYFGDDEPKDMPKITTMNSFGKEICYNEMFANFTECDDFSSTNGMLPKLIAYCACKCIPGIEEYSKRIIGVGVQKTWVAENNGRKTDYRFFQEGYCVRIWFDRDITSRDMANIVELFKKNFMTIYCSKLPKTNISLKTCGFFEVK
jgi:hypothetical protein